MSIEDMVHQAVLHKIQGNINAWPCRVCEKTAEKFMEIMKIDSNGIRQYTLHLCNKCWNKVPLEKMLGVSPYQVPGEECMRFPDTEGEEK